MLNRNIHEASPIVICLLLAMALLIGGMIGYVTGYSQAVALCVETGERILDISLNEEALATLLARFPEIIGLLK